MFSKNYFHILLTGNPRFVQREIKKLTRETLRSQGELGSAILLPL